MVGSALRVTIFVAGDTPAMGHSVLERVTSLAAESGSAITIVRRAPAGHVRARRGAHPAGGGRPHGRSPVVLEAVGEDGAVSRLVEALGRLGADVVVTVQPLQRWRGSGQLALSGEG
jgi:PII-like signaling protein